MKQSKIRILIIDDEEIFLNLLTDYLEIQGYEVFRSLDGFEALELFDQHHPDLLLVDLYIPGTSGMEILQKVQEKNPHVPVLVISGTGRMTDVLQALRLGAWDFISKPVEEFEVIDYSIRKCLERAMLLHENHEFHQHLQEKVEQRTRELMEANEQLEAMLWETVKSLTLITEKKDPYISGHQKRVADIAMALAQQLGHDEDLIQGIRVAGMLHDIGKVAVPSEFLSKPLNLLSFEMEVIRQHPSIGFEILQPIPFPWPIAEIVLQHHERWDGSGYPNGLKGEEILVEARIIAVADAVEAISSHRPYRPALGLDVALNEIQGKSGILFDPKCVEACVKLFQKEDPELFGLKRNFA